MPLLVSVLLLPSSALMVLLVVGDMLVIDSPENKICNAQSFMNFDFKKVLITLCVINNYFLAHWWINEAAKEIGSQISLETLKFTMDIRKKVILNFV